MAEIFNFDKRFIHVAVKSTFIAKYPNWEAEATALGNIIFFKDTCEIWTLGTTYGITPETMQEIADLRDDLDNLNLVTGFTDENGGAIAADGATVVPIKGEGAVSVTVGTNGIVINVPVVEEYKSGSAIEIDEDKPVLVDKYIVGKEVEVAGNMVNPTGYQTVLYVTAVLYIIALLLSVFFVKTPKNDK